MEVVADGNSNSDVDNEPSNNEEYNELVDRDLNIMDESMWQFRGISKIVAIALNRLIQVQWYIFNYL